MRLSHLCLAILFVAACSPSSFGADNEITRDIETILAEEGLTGIAWSMVRNEEDVSVGAAGMRDNLSGIEFSADTRFHVGSVTKALLATGVLRMATEGLLDLDAPVARYLPDLPFNNAWDDQSAVTVRHLLDHTSGIGDAYLWQMFSQRPSPDTPLVAAFPEPLKQLRVRSRPGARFSYSNMGYTLLGTLIERVTGRPYEIYLDEHLLAPLGMHNSTFAFTTQEGAGADPSLAWGHVDDGSRYAASPMFLRPAGQFTSTASDLAVFAQFLMGDGRIDGQVFISETLMRSRGKPFGTEAADAGLVAGYALGLGRRDRHGVTGYCHGGNIVGFAAMFCVFPDEGKAFAYSVNTDNETADYGRLDRLFVQALDVAPATAPPEDTATPDVAAWHGHYMLSPNRFESFVYLDRVFGAIRIAAQDASSNSLILTSLQQDARVLRPVGSRRYVANDRATASHVLLQGSDGKYLLSDGFRTYARTSAAGLVAHWTSLTLGLTGLAWLLLAGIGALLRAPGTLLRTVQGPAFIAMALLLLPLPLFMAQSFMVLGDLTLASGTLAIVMLLLPFAALMTAARAAQAWRISRWNRVHALAAIFVLQWCGVLAANGMLPFRLWAS